MPIKEATIEIQGNREKCYVDEEDTCSAFEVNLKLGVTNLYAWFYDKDNYYTAAYYIDIELV